MGGSRKILIVGDKGVGKTTFVRRHSTGDFKVPAPTVGCDREVLAFRARATPASATERLEFEVHACEGKEGLPPCARDAAAVIVMFDVTSAASYASAPRWLELVRGLNVPVVLCGTKVDEPGRRVFPQNIEHHRTYKLQYYDISAKSNYNYEKPFLYLARQLLVAPELTFVPEDV